MIRRPLGLVGRLGWGVADQGVSSLSNFAIGIVVARSLGSEGFGAFSLAYVTYAFVLNAMRGLATDPLLVRFSGAPREAWRKAAGAASATALGSGVVAGAICVLVGLLLPPGVGGAFIALGVGLPGLMLQDSWRFVFFSQGRPAKALVNDLVWGLSLLAVLLSLLAAGRATVVTCVLAFGATGALAAGFGFLQSRIAPRPSRVGAWIVDNKALGGRYLVENVSIGGARQLRFFILGAAAGLAAVGEVRAAEILMGPFLVILMGASQVAVPEAVHVLERAPRRLWLFCLGLGAALATAAATWGVAIWLLLPTGLGELLLGPIWESAGALLPAVIIGMFSGGFEIAAAAGVRGLGAARRSLTAQLANGTLYLVGGGLGAVLDGARGSCWGVALANTLGALVWWVQLRRALNEFPTTSPASRSGLEHSGQDELMTNAQGAFRDGETPTVSIGIPVYNGERYLAQALDAFLKQTYEDFELIISDNASTDSTEQICRSYAARDPRVRYIRQPVNIGADPNHQFVVGQARGKYFKWGSHDDLYEPDFLRLCVEALEANPDAVLATAADGIIDESGELVHVPEYRVDTANPRPSGRLRSLLYVAGGNDDYGLMYTDVIRRLPAYGTGGYGSDRVFIAAMALQGPFHHVPQVLYFRRDHPNRVSRAGKRDRALVNDPRRSRRRWNPMPRMHVEYVLGYVYAIWRAPLPFAERLRCWLEVAGWTLNRMSPRPAKRMTEPDLESTP